MKLALLGPSHPYRGGIAHYTASLYTTLSESGHDVNLYNFTRQYPDSLFPGTTQRDHSQSPIAVPDERCIDTVNPFNWVSAAAKIAKTKPDIVVIQWWHPYFAPSYGSIVRLLRRMCGCRVVFVCHNVMPHEASRADRLLLRYAFSAADGFLVQAEKERALLRQFVGFEPPVEVVPHPVYEVFARAAEIPSRREARDRLNLSSERVLLFFGYIRPYKGLGVLLQAMPLLETEDVGLVIAGECYEDKRRYLDLIERLGISQRVSFRDQYIPNEEVPDYFAAADLVTLPYLSATQSGIVQVAYAFGVPVVVTDVGGIPEVVEEGVSGLLVPPDNPRAFAAAVDRFFREDLDAELRAGILQKRDSFRWDRVMEAILQVGRKHAA